MKRIIFLSSLILLSIDASTIQLTPNSIAPYKKSIAPFIEKKRSELAKLNYLPSSDSIFGSIANFFVGSVVSPLLGYGEINVDHARTFLARTFANEKKLYETIASIEQTPENLAYINSIFKELPQEVLTKQKKSDFFKIVRSVRHAHAPLPKTMGDKNADGNYLLADENFYNYAASNFMSFHIFESHAATKKPKGRKKPAITVALDETVQEGA